MKIKVTVDLYMQSGKDITREIILTARDLKEIAEMKACDTCGDVISARARKLDILPYSEEF